MRSGNNSTVVIGYNDMDVLVDWFRNVSHEVISGPTLSMKYPVAGSDGVGENDFWKGLPTVRSVRGKVSEFFKNDAKINKCS